LSDLKEKFGEPYKVIDRNSGVPLVLGLKAWTYCWKDDRTKLDLSYGAPTRDPVLGRQTLAALNWTIIDESLQNEYKEEEKRLNPNISKKQREQREQWGC